VENARLIADREPFPGGAENMARDEALLAACTQPNHPVVLRFYGWEEPTISLGYFQEFSEFESLESPARDLAIVRRTTGGGAILHDLEVTYSLVIPLIHPLVAGKPNTLYRVAHEAIIRTIGQGTRMLGTKNESCDAPLPKASSSSQRGPFFCFERRHDLDVVVDDPRGPEGVSKIAGSAQRRTRTAILQHGSIMLDSRYPQQNVCTWTGLAGPINYEQALSRLADSFSKSLEMNFELSDWTADELDSARHINRIYAGDDWTVRRTRLG
jgi:lipoate-protein ligase A